MVDLTKVYQVSVGSGQDKCPLNQFTDWMAANEAVNAYRNTRYWGRVILKKFSLESIESKFLGCMNFPTTILEKAPAY